MSAGNRLEPIVGTLIVDVWNVGQALGKGRRLIRALRHALKGADVIGLLEAARYTPALRAALGHWWIIYRAHVPGADKSSDVIVLIHKRRVPRPRIRTIGHTTPWRGPKAGIRHRGRSWPVLEWLNLTIAILHKTPGGPEGGTSPDVAGANRPAWEDDLEVIEDLVDELPLGHPAALLGDMNAKRGELDELAELGLLVRYVIGVDHGAMTMRRDEVDVAVLPKDGSDHPRLRWTLTP